MTITRIERRFQALKQQKRAGLVTFTMAYDPDEETSLSILKQLPQAGADIIEIGMPFTDPMADGPSIAEAGQRALKAGAKLSGVLDMVRDFRKNNQDTPIILMGYVNPVFHYGYERFSKDAADAGIDGLIIVDLPPEEDDELFQAAGKQGLAMIKLLTPTTDEARLKTILPKATGFLYYVSVAGITGTKSATQGSIANALATFRKHTSLPIVVGFGIKTPEQAAAVAKVADGVVVGSALVREIATNLKAPEKAVLQLTESLARSVQGTH